MKVEAEVSSKQVLQKFLQHIRDFDLAHFDEVKIKMWIDAPMLKKEEILEIYRTIRPPFPYEYVIDLKPKN